MILSRCNEEPKHNLYIPRATKENILKIIKKINPNKAPGIDKVRMKDMQLVADKILEPMADLINESIKKGIFPDCLKRLLSGLFIKIKARRSFITIGRWQY